MQPMEEARDFSRFIFPPGQKLSHLTRYGAQILFH